MCMHKVVETYTEPVKGVKTGYKDVYVRPQGIRPLD